MVYCSKCGNENEVDPDAKFCNYCGADMGINKPTETMEPQKTTVSSPPPSSETQQSKIITPKDNDSPKIIYANFGERFVAWIIDFVLVVVISIILFSIATFFYWHGL